MNIDQINKVIEELLLDIHEATALTEEEKANPRSLISKTDISTLLWNFLHSSKYKSMFSYDVFSSVVNELVKDKMADWYIDLSHLIDHHIDEQLLS